MKSQKGFSLVELLVVIAIIGFLASVGIVGFQRYIEVSQRSIALQNFNTLSKFLSTEMILLNNDIKEKSSSIKVGSNFWKKNTHNLDSFLNGASLQHDLGVGLGGFKNPFKRGSQKQIYSASNFSDATDPHFTNKGNIVIRVHPNFPNDGAKIMGPRRFQVIYYIKDGVFDESMISSYILQ